MTQPSAHIQALKMRGLHMPDYRTWFAIASSLAILGCRQKVEPGRTQLTSGIPIPANAQTITVAVEPYRETIDVMGTVVSAAHSQISAKLSATVDGVFVIAGQTVTNGELLVKLDDRDLKTQLVMAQVQSTQADSDLRRITKLFEQQAATEQMKTAADTAASTARSQLDRALVTMSWAEIRSPMNGVVTDKQINEGDLANPGQPLLAVYDPKQLRLDVAVPARLIPLFFPGEEVSVTLDNPTRDTKGVVEEIVSEADPTSRTQKVKARLQDTADLRPGQFGRLWVTTLPRDAMFLPQSAIYHSGQLEFVQVAADGRAERRLVKTGRSDGARVEIISGLNVGETVLTQPVM